jgi:hypothetical protein
MHWFILRRHRKDGLALTHCRLWLVMTPDLRDANLPAVPHLHQIDLGLTEHQATALPGSAMGWYRMLVVAEIPKDRSVHTPTTGGVPVHSVAAGIKYLVQPMLVGNRRSINLLITGGMSRRNLVVGVKRPINLIGDHRLVRL